MKSKAFPIRAIITNVGPNLIIGKPEIFNSAQGSQYTSTDFTSILLSHEILISMDGNDRYHSALDYKIPKEVYVNGKRSLKDGTDK